MVTEQELSPDGTIKLTEHPDQVEVAEYAVENSIDQHPETPVADVINTSVGATEQTLENKVEEVAEVIQELKMTYSEEDIQEMFSDIIENSYFGRLFQSMVNDNPPAPYVPTEVEIDALMDADTREEFAEKLKTMIQKAHDEPSTHIVSSYLQREKKNRNINEILSTLDEITDENSDYGYNLRNADRYNLNWLNSDDWKNSKYMAVLNTLASDGPITPKSVRRLKDKIKEMLDEGVVTQAELDAADINIIKESTDLAGDAGASEVEIEEETPTTLAAKRLKAVRRGDTAEAKRLDDKILEILKETNGTVRGRNR